MKPYLTCKNISKTFDGATAVESVSIDLLPGEIMSILGPSGCGKTTLLRLIAGFETIDEGEIKIENNIISSNQIHLPPEKRNIGMVFQDYSLFPHMNVEQNITFGLQNYNQDEKEFRLQEILKLIQLVGFEKKLPAELSGGQQQRIALGRTLAPKPSLILLDEPFSNLDPPLKDKLRAEIRGILTSTKTTAIIVSHDAEDAFALANRIALLRNGEISQYGTPSDLYNNPVNEYVASQVGPSNIINGIALEDGYLTDIGHLYCPVTEPLNQSVKICIRPNGFSLTGKSSRSIQVKILELILGRGGSYFRVGLPINNKSTSKELIVKKPSCGEYQIGSFIGITALPDKIWCFPNPSFELDTD